jgi:hypothetical protein
VTVDKEHRLRVFKNRVLRKICGRRREDVTKGLREPHEKQLRNFYASLNMRKLKRWAVYVASMGDR